jgi:hypothetical protein
MQKMLDICSEIALDLDLCFNVRKSVALRVGMRFKKPCVPLVLSGNIIEWVQSVKYLGVCIKSGLHFTCSFDHVKISFYRAFNSIYSRSKASDSEMVSVFLLKSTCIPITSYALEAIAASNSNVQALDKLIECALNKMFNVRESENISCLRRVLNLPTFRTVSHLQTCKFLLKFLRKSFSFAGIIFKLAMRECRAFLRNYGVNNKSTDVQQLCEAVRIIATRP